MAINRPQYAKEIDENVLPVSNGLFTPGSPYYSSTSYPAYNPTEAKKLVKQVAKSTGKPVTFTWGSPNSPTSEREQQYLQQAWQDVGFVVKNTIVEQNDLINNALAGTYQALEWRQFGAVDPDLNYIFWSNTTILSSSLSVNMARNKDPQLQAALQAGPHERHSPGHARQGVPDRQQAPGHRPALSVAGPGRVGRRQHAQGAELEQSDHANRVPPPMG